MQKIKVIVSVTNDLATDNRVKKVCDFLHEHNFEVVLLGRLLKNSLPINDRLYKTKRFKLLLNKGAFFYANYNLRLFWYLLFHKADVLVANDLDTLLANGLIKRFRPKTKLVYDSHEYFTGVPELINRPKVQKFWKRIEKKYFKRADIVYTVNESIANLYCSEYKKPVLVVRNIGDYSNIQKTKSRADLGLPSDKKIIIFQGAGINVDRGGEELVDAMSFLSTDYLLLFVGDGDVINLLKEKTTKLNLNERIKFISKMPYTDLLQYTFNADLGVSLDKNTNINYQYSLPNKLFDYINCEVPVLVSELVEIKKIVSEYNVGIFTEVSAKAIATNIANLFADINKYNQLKANTKIASASLNWKNESKVLEKIYL